MIVIYLIFLVTYNFFLVTFYIETVDENFSVEKFKVFGAVSEKLIQKDNILSKILGYTLIPFISFDILIYLIGVITIGIASGSPILNAIVYIPFTLIITVDYILPLIRGN